MDSHSLPHAQSAPHTFSLPLIPAHELTPSHSVLPSKSLARTHSLSHSHAVPHAHTHSIPRTLSLSHIHTHTHTHRHTHTLAPSLQTLPRPAAPQPPRGRRGGGRVPAAGARPLSALGNRLQDKRGRRRHSARPAPHAGGRARPQGTAAAPQGGSAPGTPRTPPAATAQGLPPAGRRDRRSYDSALLFITGRGAAGLVT